MGCEFEWWQVNLVTRPFIVKREVLAAMANFHQTARIADPTALPGFDWRQRPARFVSRLERVPRQEVLQIGEDQFLMLFLVIAA